MVSIVALVLQTELSFIMFFAVLFLRKIENYSFMLVASTILIIIGVILIAFS